MKFISVLITLFVSTLSLAELNQDISIYHIDGHDAELTFNRLGQSGGATVEWLGELPQPPCRFCGNVDKYTPVKRVIFRNITCIEGVNESSVDGTSHPYFKCEISITD